MMTFLQGDIMMLSLCCMLKLQSAYAAVVGWIGPTWQACIFKLFNAGKSLPDIARMHHMHLAWLVNMLILISIVNASG